MNMVRYMHASCALGDHVYVFGGTRGFATSSISLLGKEDENFALIECYDTMQVGSPWLVLNVATSLDFLIKPAVASLNNHQVVILGGQTV